MGVGDWVLGVSKGWVFAMFNQVLEGFYIFSTLCASFGEVVPEDCSFVARSVHYEFGAGVGDLQVEFCWLPRCE